MEFYIQSLLFLNNQSTWTTYVYLCYLELLMSNILQTITWSLRTNDIICKENVLTHHPK